jgi:hypothetical protein
MIYIYTIIIMKMCSGAESGRILGPNSAMPFQKPAVNRVLKLPN